MEDFWAYFASTGALMVFGEALRHGLPRFFRRWFPDRGVRCPQCGRGRLVLALSRGELVWLGVLNLVFSLAFTAALLLAVVTLLMLLALFGGAVDAGMALGVALALAVSTLVARFVVRPIRELGARPPVSCADCGYRWA
ncbi:hypothetical protein Lesp02_85440 [Lentzea sp. NBRC 105346]|uniref:hypothetical protein n=1 Tax=Lentzea sp. NBRC 105346 TaxID=3032205 RepID=UPI0024A2F870|nr:hypothetical protein [Lentzea sp. NBRC 105346]GLZ36357.1 hypothetical protein Lesp02_85440 [Lentzea sp. NBRC 105346]